VGAGEQGEIVAVADLERVGVCKAGLAGARVGRERVGGGRAVGGEPDRDAVAGRFAQRRLQDAVVRALAEGSQRMKRDCREPIQLYSLLRISCGRWVASAMVVSWSRTSGRKTRNCSASQPSQPPATETRPSKVVRFEGKTATLPRWSTLPSLGTFVALGRVSAAGAKSARTSERRKVGGGGLTSL
jgi:hypothetical protein